MISAKYARLAEPPARLAEPPARQMGQMEQQPQPHLYDEFQSPLTPPKWVIQLVWPVLYLVLFVSFIFCLRENSCNTIPLVTFFVQLLFNIIWYPLMFLVHMPRLALLDLFLLLVTVIVMIMYWPPPLNYLHIPYLLWCSFAFYLNLVIVWNLQKRRYTFV